MGNKSNKYERREADGDNCCTEINFFVSQSSPINLKIQKDIPDRDSESGTRPPTGWSASWPHTMRLLNLDEQPLGDITEVQLNHHKKNRKLGIKNTTLNHIALDKGAIVFF